MYTTTNAAGAYTLPVPAGTYNVTFALDGYSTATYGSTTPLSAELHKLSFVDSLGVWLWVIVLGALAVIVVLAFLLTRRRKASPPGT